MVGELRQGKPDCPGGVASGRGTGLLGWVVPFHHGEESFRAWFGVVNRGLASAKNMSPSALTMSSCIASPRSHCQSRSKSATPGFRKSTVNSFQVIHTLVSYL